MTPELPPLLLRFAATVVLIGASPFTLSLARFRQTPAPTA